MCYHSDMVELRSHWSSDDKGESGSDEESLETGMAVPVVPVTGITRSVVDPVACRWVQSCWSVIELVCCVLGGGRVLEYVVS